MRPHLVVGVVAVLLATGACGSGTDAEPGSGARASLTRAETESFVRAADDLTGRAFGAAAEQVGERLDRSAPPTFVTCREQGAGAVELQSRGSLRYDAARGADAVSEVERAWTDLGLEVVRGDDSLTATTTLDGVEVRVSFDEAVAMRDGSEQELRYLGASTPSCLDVGTEVARELVG